MGIRPRECHGKHHEPSRDPVSPAAPIEVTEQVVAGPDAEPDLFNPKDAAAAWAWQPPGSDESGNSTEAGATEAPIANPGEEDTADDLDLTTIPHVTLYRGAVPGELDPGRFLATMCNLVLDRTPINFHREARARRRSAGERA